MDDFTFPIRSLSVCILSGIHSIKTHCEQKKKEQPFERVIKVEPITEESSDEQILSEEKKHLLAKCQYDILVYTESTYQSKGDSWC